MSGTNCSINKDNIEIQLQNESDREEFFDNYSAVRKLKNEALELMDILENEYSKGQFIDESIINQKINKLYGKNSEAKKLAIKIRALMDGNESLAEYLHQFIIEHIGKNQKVGTAVSYDKKTGKYKQVSRKLVLSRLPIATLHLIYNEALEPSRWTSGIGLMNFNGILSPIMTPKQRGKKEPSGAYWQVQRATNKYADKIAHRISRFMSKHEIMDKKGNRTTLWKGMTSIYERIKNLQDAPLLSKISSTVDLGRLYTRIFTGLMSGRILTINEYVNNKGKTISKEEYSKLSTKDKKGWNTTKTLYINKDHGRLTETKKIQGVEVEVTRRHKDKSAMYGWSNLVKLEEYTPPNREKGDWFVDMNKDTFNELISLTEEARKIDDEVFKYMEKHMEKSLEYIRNELQAAFPGLNKENVTAILFRPESKEGKKAIKKLTNEQKEVYDMLYEALSPHVNNEFTIATGHMGDKKKKHWPTIFNTDIFKSMIDKMISDFDGAIDSLNEAIETKKDSKGNEVTPLDVIEFRKDIAEFNSKRLNAENVRQNIDDYPLDMQNQLVISMASENKYFKRITNAYDHRGARTDNGVYYDYLKNVMASIERNYLSGELIKALLMSKKKNTPQMHEIVSKSMINLYKVPFHGTDLYRKGFLSRLFPGLGTVEGMNNMLNKIPGYGLVSHGLRAGKFYRQKTAARLNKTYRIMASATTGMYLLNLGTTVQNWADSARNIIAFGFETTQEAYRLLKDPEAKKDIERILQISGILEFSDFFSRSMVNNLTESKIEAAISDKILRQMLVYSNNKIKADKITIPSRRKKVLEEIKQNFIDKVEGLLKQSSTFMSAEDYYDNMLTPEQTKHRKSETKQRRRMLFTNALVQFAITKEYEFRNVLNQQPWSKFANMSAKVAVEAYRQVSTLGQAPKFTMSSTEKFVRSLSFVIGANRAHAAGLLRQDIPWYKAVNLRDINEVIYYGRAYSEKMNFGLSTQATGEYNYNTMGNLMGKFKYWSQQKFGSDVRIFKEAYVSLKSLEGIESNSFEVSAVLKTMGKMFRGNKTLRTTNPEVAYLKSFLLTQGLLTIAIDLATLSPALPMLRQILWMGSGGKMLRGYTSDLVSLMMMVPMIAGMILRGSLDDEEEYERTLKYYMRKTFFGFVPMWAFDNILWMLNLFTGNIDRAVDGVIDASSVIRGGSIVSPIQNSFLNKKLKEKNPF